MTSPTPSLPAAIREALSEYRSRVRRAVETLKYNSGDPDRIDAQEAEVSSRTALEAHLLALVAKAERYDTLREVMAMCSTGPFGPWYPIGAYNDDRETMPSLDEYADAARLTPPEDTTPHG